MSPSSTLTWLEEAAISWLPALISIVLSIAVIAIVRLVHRTRTQKYDSRVSINHQLVVLLLGGAAIVAVILTLPIEHSDRAQLLSLLGLLLSAAIALSSTTFIGNALAGLMLRALKKMRPGDFVRVDDSFGRISEQGLLHTELQTEDRDLTTLPNLHLVTRPVTVVRSSGTVVSATVSLGYDNSRGDIERYLKEAAEQAGLADPFVQVAELGDFSVTYRAAGFLGEVKFLLSVRSRLRGSMLDVLHQNGVEIVSPLFLNRRALAPSEVFIPRGPGPVAVEIPEEQALPEERIFDKAELAQNKEEAIKELKELKPTIDALREKLEDENSAGERASTASELEAAEERAADLERQLADDGDSV